jgi:hypothetical protein
MFNFIDQVINYNDAVYRNVIGIELDNNSPFSDLSDDPQDWKDAQMAIDFHNRFTATELQYNAIDWVFDRQKWEESRFTDGSFPVWYGSAELETSFYETAYHWRQFLADSPDLLKISGSEPLEITRTVFNTKCQTTLIDLRNKVKDHPFLTAKDSYQDTQSLGLKLSQQGIPGLITLSARCDGGQNLVIFNQRSLEALSHQGDYLYRLDISTPNIIEVYELENEKHVTTIK